MLPNGPEMATAFVTIAQSAVTAPLNPAYRQEEFAFYLEDLKARALVVSAGADSPAVAAAESLGIAVLRLETQADQPAGQFRLVAPVTSASAGGARPDRMMSR